MKANLKAQKSKNKFNKRPHQLNKKSNSKKKIKSNKVVKINKTDNESLRLTQKIKLMIL